MISAAENACIDARLDVKIRVTWQIYSDQVRTLFWNKSHTVQIGVAEQGKASVNSPFSRSLIF